MGQAWSNVTGSKTEGQWNVASATIDVNPVPGSALSTSPTALTLTVIKTGGAQRSLGSQQADEAFW